MSYRQITSLVRLETLPSDIMTIQYACILSHWLIFRFLILLLLFQNCGTPPITTREESRRKTTNNQQATTQQTTDAAFNTPTEIHLESSANRKKDLPITSIRDIQATNQTNNLIMPTTASTVLESHLSIYNTTNEQQFDTGKGEVSISSIDRGSAKLDKGKEKLEEDASSESIKTHPTAQEITSSGTSVALPSIATFKGIAPAENLKNYYKILFFRVQDVESFNKVKTAIHSTIDKDYDLEYDKDAVTFILSHLYPYIETILHANYFDSLSQNDQLKLLNSFYELNFKIAQYNLYEMLNLTYSGQYNRLDMQRYASKYLVARNKLQTNFSVSKKLLEKNHLQILNDLYESTIGIIPEINNYINPQATKKKKPQHSGPISQRRMKAEQKTQVTHALNLMYLTTKKLLPHDESIIKLYTALFEFTEKISKEDASCLQHRGEDIEKWHQYAAKFLELEQLAFINSFSIPADSAYMPSELGAHDLVKLYEALYTTISNFDTGIYSTMRAGIMVLIMANQLSQALLRLEAADIFYASKKHPHDFENFQATAYALCGQYDRLTSLNNSIINAQLEKKRKLKERQAGQHQKRVAGIKEAQKLQASSNIPSLAVAKTEKEQQIRRANFLLETTGLSEFAYQEQIKLRQEEAEARLKRHQEAEQKRIQKRLLDDQGETEEQPIADSDNQKLAIQSQPQEQPHTDKTPSLHFFLPKRAFKTVCNIFNGNWKIKRADIENLFDVLGQNIDVATKSSHHIITIPQGIALVQQEQIIGLITGMSAGMSGHISLPSWEKEVPFYIRPQIQKMLALIGINRENYSKGNRDDSMQFVPVEG